MEAGPFFDDALAEGREYVVFRKRTPEEAVAEIERKVNAELDRIRNFLRAGAS